LAGFFAAGFLAAAAGFATRFTAGFFAAGFLAAAFFAGFTPFCAAAFRPLALRRAAWPHREIFSTLMRDDSGLVTRATQVYVRDCYDHVTQIIDIIELRRSHLQVPGERNRSSLTRVHP
jgi:hypothetical protein